MVSLDISILRAHGADKFEFLKIYLKIYIAQTVYTGCSRINYEIVSVPISMNIYSIVQVELNNIYINIGANNGSEKL